MASIAFIALMALIAPFIAFIGAYSLDRRPPRLGSHEPVEVEVYSLLIDVQTPSVKLVQIPPLDRRLACDACKSLTYRHCGRASPPVEETSTHTSPQKSARFPELGVPPSNTMTELYFEVRRCLEYRDTSFVRRVSLYQLRNVHERHAGGAEGYRDVYSSAPIAG